MPLSLVPLAVSEILEVGFNTYLAVDKKELLQNQILTDGLKKITTKIDEVEGEILKRKQANDEKLTQANQGLTRLQDEIQALNTQIKDNEGK